MMTGTSARARTERLAATSEQFLGALYDAHCDRVRGLLRRMLGPVAEVDDLLQEVFLVALRRRALVEAMGEASGGWLCGVAVRLAQASRRRSRLRRFFGLESLSEVAGDEESGRAAEAAQARRLVYAALERLTEKKRTVFVLFELEGLPGEDIAVLLGCPLKTVWSRLAHARAEFEVALARTVRPAAQGGTS